MTRDEMIEILEGIDRDEDVPATARVTAIRTLREFDQPRQPPPGAFADLNELAPRRPSGRRDDAQTANHAVCGPGQCRVTVSQPLTGESWGARRLGRVGVPATGFPIAGDLDVGSTTGVAGSNRWPDSFLATTHGSSSECAWRPDRSAPGRVHVQLGCASRLRRAWCRFRAWCLSEALRGPPAEPPTTRSL
jgi:hypothetical protein